ncbi:DNA-binding response regulator [Nesterenkonia aurantiaca]|uniref:response regulator transcription factor n=1 Tax=Nesterenkonia aurantiaca TaxID=1436010 RepID=UPI003EE5C0B4
MAGESSSGPLHGLPTASPHPAPAALLISSPVLILGGPSPAASELSQRLRGIDVKVLLASSAETARQALQVDAPELFVVEARSSRRVSDVEKVLEDLRAGAEPSAVLHWFDADVDLQGLLETVRPQDDHMAGPISVDEALRRLHFITARLPERTEGERLLVGDLELDTAARTVRRGGRDIDLSDTEFRLLRLLMRHARTVLPKAEILQQVWEYEFAGQANIVELYISYVRKKIEADMPRMIHTVRGAGYVLRPAEHGPSGLASASSAGSP